VPCTFAAVDSISATAAALSTSTAAGNGGRGREPCTFAAVASISATAAALWTSTAEGGGHTLTLAPSSTRPVTLAAGAAGTIAVYSLTDAGMAAATSGTGGTTAA